MRLDGPDSPPKELYKGKIVEKNTIYLRIAALLYVHQFSGGKKSSDRWN
jgi:hypothetical protein